MQKCSKASKEIIYAKTAHYAGKYIAYFYELKRTSCCHLSTAFILKHSDEECKLQKIINIVYS